VPLSSPRDANTDPLSAIFRSAAGASVIPATPAGSDVGPTMMKSLYITSKRWRDCPWDPSALTPWAEGVQSDPA